MKQQHQKTYGFTLIKVVLVIIGVTIIGVVGYLAFQASQKQQASTQTEKPTSSTTAPKKTETDESTVALDNVRAFYKKFLAEPNHTDGYTPSKWVADGYVTQAAADQYANATAVDPVTCSQNPLAYDKYTFDAPSISSAAGMAHISGTYESGDKTMIMLSLVKDNNVWKISKFSCSM